MKVYLLLDCKSNHFVILLKGNNKPEHTKNLFDASIVVNLVISLNIYSII